MSECISNSFILNGVNKPSSEFNADWIYKGKSVYEVCRVINGIPLFWDDHYKRLVKSTTLALLRLNFPNVAIVLMIEDLLRRNNITDGNIKLVFNNQEESDTLIIYQIAHKYPSPEEYNEGVKTITHKATRSVPNAKILDQSLRDKTNRLIKEKDIYEVLLVDDNNKITEGSKSNIFMIEGDIIYTPPTSHVLPGITRQHVFEMCRKMGLRIREKRFSLNEINQLDGLFITGTSPKILPVIQVDDFRFNFESIILRKIMLQFDQLVAKFIKDESTRSNS